MKTYLFILSLAFFGSIFSQDSLINQTDAEGLKQGKWIIYGFMKPEKNYPDSAIIQEGYYKNSRREGKWVFYSAAGLKKTEIIYVNNRPNGKYTKYYSSGTIKEVGEVRLGGHIGRISRYFQSGCLERETLYSQGGRALRIIVYSKDSCNLIQNDQLVNHGSIHQSQIEQGCSWTSNIQTKHNQYIPTSGLEGPQVSRWYETPFPVNHCQIGVYEIILKRKVSKIIDLSNEEIKTIQSFLDNSGGNSVYLDFIPIYEGKITKVVCYLTLWYKEMPLSRCDSLINQYRKQIGYLEYDRTYENLVEIRHFQRDKIPKYLVLVDSFKIELDKEIRWIDEMKNITKAEIVAKAVDKQSPFVYFDYRCVTSANNKHTYTYYLFRWPKEP